MSITYEISEVVHLRIDVSNAIAVCWIVAHHDTRGVIFPDLGGTSLLKVGFN